MAYYGWMQEGPAPRNSGVFAACNGNIEIGERNGILGLPKMESSEHTVTDTTRCCLQYCMHPVELCKKKCPTGSDCEEVCSTQENMCLETCLLSSDKWSNKINPYYQCAYKHDCLNTGTNKNNCLKRNYVSIMSCCKEDKCVPSKTVNCDDLCEMSHNLAIETELEFEIDPSVSLRNLFIETIKDNALKSTERFTMPRNSHRLHPYTRIRK